MLCLIGNHVRCIPVSRHLAAGLSSATCASQTEPEASDCRETGQIFKAAVSLSAGSAAQRDAKQQMEAAFMRMMEKRMKQEEAASAAAGVL